VAIMTFCGETNLITINYSGSVNEYDHCSVNSVDIASPRISASSALVAKLIVIAHAVSFWYLRRPCRFFCGHPSLKPIALHVALT
jgi:hypothetical protein